MKRMFLAALVGSTALVPAALTSDAMAQQNQGQNQPQMQQAQSGQMQGSEGRVTAQQMRGQPLMGSQGNRIGTVQQIVIGRSGQSYAVVQVQGGENRLLPTSAIVMRDDRLFVQDMTRADVDTLRSATEQEQGEFQRADAEQVLVIAMETTGETEREGSQQRRQMAQADGADIVVERTAPRLLIEQPEPQVLVDPAEPRVTVRQMNPQIIVRQAPPTVTIQQPQPEIIVRMPEPQVDVATGQPDVQVRQGQPQVQVQQPQESAAVSVQQGQAQVRIQDGDEQPQVAMQRGQPEVSFERTGEPQVVFQAEQGQPTVRYERMEQQAGMQQQGDRRQQQAQMTQERRGGSMQTEEREAQMRDMLIDENEVEATGAIQAQTRPVAITELEGEPVYNFRGQELGDVERIVATPNGDFLVVIGAGGFLGLGEDTVALPLQRLSMRGDELMVRGITEADIEAMQDYETRYPNAERVGPGEEVDVGIFE